MEPQRKGLLRAWWFESSQRVVQNPCHAVRNSSAFDKLERVVRSVCGLLLVLPDAQSWMAVRLFAKWWKPRGHDFQKLLPLPPVSPLAALAGRKFPWIGCHSRKHTKSYLHSRPGRRPPQKPATSGDVRLESWRLRKRLDHWQQQISKARRRRAQARRLEVLPKSSMLFSFSAAAIDWKPLAAAGRAPGKVHGL